MTDQRDLAKEVERIVATAEQHGDNTIYSLSDIKTLLLQIASQSRELEELRKLNIQLGTARQPVGHPAWVDAVRNRALHYPDGAMLDDIYALLGQVDELRRPVVDSEYVKRVRAYVEAKPRAHEPCQSHFEVLLSALDSAQGEIQQLKNTRRPVGHSAEPAIYTQTDMDCMENAGVESCVMRDKETEILRSKLDTSIKAGYQLSDQLEAAQREIARLSSPPEERREIAERRKLGYSSASVHLLEMYNLALADIDTLIQDNIRYRNAHAILLAERDEARQSLRQQNDLHQARKDLVVQLTSERDEARGKVERIGKLCESLTAESVTLAANAEYQAQQLAELERCKRAIDWCLENGATRAFWPQPHERFLIGSDLERLAVPAEFADIIKPAAGGDGRRVYHVRIHQIFQYLAKATKP